MIRVSTNGRYALRSMLDLALHHNEGPVLRQDIADRQNISAEYVAQIFRQLVKNGLVRGIKGPGGGYLLARRPSEIRIGDIIRAVEGPIAPVHCVSSCDRETCDRVETCVPHIFWGNFGKVIDQFLDSVTLEDLHQQELEMMARGQTVSDLL